MIQTITFHFHEVSCQLRHRRILKRVIGKLLGKHGFSSYSISVVFCSDDYLLEINRSFLNHNYHTDIITFDLSDTKDALVGEMYISIDRVRENAPLHGVTFSNELYRVIFHGILHLCGYKDKTTNQSKTMKSAEDKQLSIFLKKVSRETISN